MDILRSNYGVLFTEYESIDPGFVLVNQANIKRDFY